ncbi:putative site-specific integrase-resolvase [Parabacteroides sp. PFB2-10]|uniref:helix-turn-helix domain-containing protein n=1 Tax=Parabacteroides sp. PFB2-10 TaxID=1742405 RepID=UPI002474FD6A|nr:helix-turn-helix domain-containing protein [Parabacteroides sp. PFB2-10]MDH6313008.1 putative site-specific integrase-resolvase [Parabacteroides sp. PFB2-10]
MDSADVCRTLSISKRTLQTWRNTGKIAYSMLGGKVYYHQSDVEALVQSGMKRR